MVSFPFLDSPSLGSGAHWVIEWLTKWRHLRCQSFYGFEAVPRVWWLCCPWPWEAVLLPSIQPGIGPTWICSLFCVTKDTHCPCLDLLDVCPTSPLWERETPSFSFNSCTGLSGRWMAVVLVCTSLLWWRSWPSRLTSVLSACDNEWSLVSELQEAEHTAACFIWSEDQEAVGGNYLGDGKKRKDDTVVLTCACNGAVSHSQLLACSQLPSADLSSPTSSLQEQFQIHKLPRVSLETPGLRLASVSA